MPPSAKERYIQKRTSDKIPGLGQYRQADRAQRRLQNNLPLPYNAKPQGWTYTGHGEWIPNFSTGYAGTGKRGRI